MQTRRTFFVTPMTPNLRRRHEHLSMGKRVTYFAVQLEFYWERRWTPIVRYDTAHGFAHRDILSPSGRVDKTPLFLHSFNEALTFAEADLRANWRSYVERFMKEVQR